MPYPLENARFQWEEGAARVESLADDPGAQRRARRIIEEIREELRRRLGTTFKAEDLAELYGRGTDWCLEIALAHSGDGIDARDAVDAAFWEHLRLARDFAGGVRFEPDEESDRATR